MFSLEVALLDPSSANPTKIPCTVRLMKQSRCLRIQISRTSGLLVTAPKRTSQKAIRQFIDENHAWINKHWHLYQAQLAKITPQVQSLPTHLELAAINERWTLNYENASSKLCIEERENYVLHIKGNTNAITDCHNLIKLWLKSHAQHHFASWFNQVSEEISIPYQQLVIRTQKTRWGSCTSKGKIQLNSKLLFFSEKIVRYVMIHELCHIRFMNHSANYWKLVKRFEPEFQLRRAQIRQESINIPSWL